MAREFLEHYGPGKDKERITELRRSGLEVVFGRPEDQPCDLLPPETFPVPEDVRPDPELRRRGGVPDDETGPDSRTVYWRFFSSAPDGPGPPPLGSSTRRFGKRIRTAGSEPSCASGSARPRTAKSSGAGSRKPTPGPCW